MAWYNIGTTALTSGSPIVVGTGTNFEAGALPGHALIIDGATFEIASVEDQTHLTLATAYSGPSATGKSYSIAPTQTIARETNALVSELLVTFGPVRATVVDINDKIDDRADGALAAQVASEAARDEAAASAVAAGLDRIAAGSSEAASAASQTAAAASATTAQSQAAIVTEGRKLASATIALAFPKNFDPSLVHAGIAYVGNASQVTSLEDAFPTVVDAGRTSVTVPMALGGTSGAQIGLNGLVAYAVGRTYRFYADLEAVSAGAETALQCGFYARLQDATYGASGNLTLTASPGSAIIPVGSRQVITRDVTITSATATQVWMRPGLLINRSPTTIGSNLLGASTRIHSFWIEDITDRTAAASSASAAAASATGAAASAAAAATFNPSTFMPKSGGAFTGAVTGITNSMVGLGNVEDKSSATIRGEITSANVVTALGFTPIGGASPTFTGTVTAPTFAGALAGNATTATTLATARTMSMSGDVTWNSGAFNGSANVTAAATIAARAVTFSKIQNVSTGTILGRVTAATGAVEQLTPAQARTMLTIANVEDKSSATIRSEITSANVTGALGYTPFNNARVTISAANPTGGADGDIWFKV